MIRCRVVRRASWAARGAGRRARAASSCAWSMIRGSGVVTGIVCLGSVAGFGAGTGPVGELWSLCWVRPLSCSSELFVESASAVQVEAGRRTHLWRRLGQWLGWAKQRASPRRTRGTSPATRSQRRTRNGPRAVGCQRRGSFLRCQLPNSDVGLSRRGGSQTTPAQRQHLVTDHCMDLRRWSSSALGGQSGRTWRPITRGPATSAPASVSAW